MMKDYKITKLQSTDNGAKFKIDVRIPMSTGWLDDMYFTVVNNHKNTYFKLKFVKNENDYVYFSNKIELGTSAVYRWFFEFKANGERKFLDKDSTICNFLNNDKLGKLSVNFEVPDWAKGAIMYHIFVDRFNRGEKNKPEYMPRRKVYESFESPVEPGFDGDMNVNNDFYGGDLKGITDKLSYIKSLGTDIIYLSPIVTSQSNHRYDTADYENVDPYCGKNEDLKELCDKAHSMGMKVVLDAVFSHTGDDSKYFNRLGTYDTVGAFQDSNSEYGKFYEKTYKDGKTYFNYWWCFENLPKCNKYAVEWQNFIYGKGGIIDKWFDLGIDGLRLDVADDLPDEFIAGIRKAVKRNKEDGLVIGEVWYNPMEMGRGYLSSGKCLDTVMNYFLIDSLLRYYKYGDVSKFSRILKEIYTEFPKDTINTLMNFTSTHDISRPLSIFGRKEYKTDSDWAWDIVRNDNEPFTKVVDRCKILSNLTEEELRRAKEIYKSYTYCLDFMPGIFSIFYGDEAGVLGYGNLFNRKPFPWNNIDKELLEHFKALGMIRKENDFLKTADFNVVDITKDYFMFERNSDQGDALVAVNRTDNETKIFIPSKYDGNDVTNEYNLNKSRKTLLKPYGGISLIKK